MEESNINTLETSNLKVFKEQGEQLKKYQEEIIILKQQNLNLITENSNLKVNINVLSAQNAANVISEKAMKEKDEFIEKLSNDIILKQKEFNSYKNKQDELFEKEINQVNLQQENLKYKIDNVSKIENLNKIFYYKILELENILKNFSLDEKKKLENMELKHQNKMANFKLKMLDYLKKTHEYSGVVSNTQNILNNKLNILHVQELKNELEIQSKVIEDLLREREILKRKVYDLTNDMKIYVSVTKCLGQKNLEYQNKLHEMSQPINNSKNDNNKNVNDGSEKKIKEKKNHISIDSFIKFKPVPIVDMKDINKKKNSNTNEKKNKYLITKELLSKEKEKENYRLKYETAQSKLDYINKKYYNILKLYESVLEKIYNDYIDKNIDNIYLNIEDFTECNFDKMNNEQKYAVLVQMINNIFPIINKNCIDNEFLKEKIPQIKIKYAIRDNRSKTINHNLNSYGYTNTSIDHSTYGSTTLDNFSKNSYKTLKKIKMEPLSEIPYRRNRILLKDNKIRLKTFVD